MGTSRNKCRIESLSSLVTSQAFEQRAEPQPSHSFNKQRLPVNQQMGQPIEYITTYDRVPIHDRVILKSDTTSSYALQIIANLKSEFHTYHHREVVHISYEPPAILTQSRIRHFVMSVINGVFARVIDFFVTLNKYGLRQ